MLTMLEDVIFMFRGLLWGSALSLLHDCNGAASALARLDEGRLGPVHLDPAFAATAKNPTRRDRSSFAIGARGIACALSARLRMLFTPWIEPRSIAVACEHPPFTTRAFLSRASRAKAECAACASRVALRKPRKRIGRSQPFFEDRAHRPASMPQQSVRAALAAPPIGTVATILCFWALRIGTA
jgi:hypothetical protein